MKKINRYYLNLIKYQNLDFWYKILTKEFPELYGFDKYEKVKMEEDRIKELANYLQIPIEYFLSDEDEEEEEFNVNNYREFYNEMNFLRMHANINFSYLINAKEELFIDKLNTESAIAKFFYLFNNLNEFNNFYEYVVFTLQRNDFLVFTTEEKRVNFALSDLYFPVIVINENQTMLEKFQVLIASIVFVLSKNSTVFFDAKKIKNSNDGINRTVAVITKEIINKINNLTSNKLTDFFRFYNDFVIPPHRNFFNKNLIKGIINSLKKENENSEHKELIVFLNKTNII